MHVRVLPVAWLSFALTAVLGQAAAASASERATTETTRIRPTAQRLRDAIDEGMSRSATFRSLVDRLEQSDVIVHVMPQLRPRDLIGGELQFAVASGGARYLRITIRTDLSTPHLIALIGHEFQHALEVAARDSVVDSKTFDALYREIGFRNRSRCHETHAARRVESLVQQELDR